MVPIAISATLPFFEGAQPATTFMIQSFGAMTLMFATWAWAAIEAKKENAAKIAERRRQFMATFGVPPEALSAEEIGSIRKHLDELRESMRFAVDELATFRGNEERREAFHLYALERARVLREANDLSLEFLQTV